MTRVRALLFSLLPLLACAKVGPSVPPPRTPAAQVRFRPADALPTLGADARIDRGLRAAAEELAAGALTPEARLAPGPVRIALARAGYPGDARFVRVVGDRELPEALLAGLPRNIPLDLGWAWRDLPDGRRWWVLGWAPRPVQMDPVPRNLPLDGAFALRVAGLKQGRLLVASPHGTVSELGITDARARWVARFTEPGEHRVEVVDGDRVALLFSVFVEQEAPAPRSLPGPASPERPEAAEAWLGQALDQARDSAGLPRLQPWTDFVPHARAHASCLVSAGVLAHATPACPGVASLARATHHPAARHHEDVAAGETAPEAWERILASPGHLKNLLCSSCTHAAIGVASDSQRVFATLELLEFPAGAPRPIPRRK